MAYIIKDKIQFLAKASKILSSSLDYSTTLSSIARLVVNNIADFCMIDLMEEDNLLHRVATYVYDKKKQKLADEMFNYPPDPRNKQAIYDTARTGKPILIKRITKKWLNRASRISKKREVLQKLGVRSFIFTPLISGKKIIGVLTLVSSGKDFSYSKEDLLLASEIASRAGVAVDKARLFSEVKEALRTRDLFIAMAAHELRTPITTIQGYVQMLYSKFAGSNTPEARWIENLFWETLRLSSLVNELLEINRIKSGQLRYFFKECNLREIINRSISSFHFTHPGYKIVFQDRIENGSSRVVGDFDKLLQVVTNLLDNAVKFSPPGTEIIVELKSKARYLTLGIKDQGKGIFKKDLYQIFEKFYQGANHSKEGMGIGLFLVKNIINMHRGSIKVSSKKDEGTKMIIKLPLISDTTL